ncbi:MAG: ExbD/TolR family protein [Candidatus Zhuqueibacterota bacterium]
MKFQMTKQRLVAFSTISLTDIVLLLLIFFLLSSSFFVQPGIKVDLPKALTGQPEMRDRIYISITDRELIFVNHRKVAKSDLSYELSQLLKTHPEKMVVLQADKDLTVEVLVEVVDIAKLAGAQKFMIATQPGSRL